MGQVKVDREILPAPQGGKEKEDKMLSQGNDNLVTAEFVEAIQRVSYEWMRPSIIFRPVITLDGDQFCCLLGSNPQEGIAGFGDTPDQACRAFDEAWYKSV